MSVSEAADIFETTKRKMDELKPLLEASGAVVKAHLEKTGKADYRGRIALSHGGRTVLDTDKVKAELGTRLPKFQKRTTYTYLTLLKK